MIDWIDVLIGALWISGCALALATVSYANWAAATRREKLRVLLGQPRIQVVLDFAAILFCLGWMGSVDAFWERALWGILALAFGVQAGLTWSSRDD